MLWASPGRLLCPPFFFCGAACLGVGVGLGAPALGEALAALGDLVAGGGVRCAGGAGWCRRLSTWPRRPKMCDYQPS